MAIELTRHASLQHTQNHIHIEFSQPHQIMSSAVLNGGFVSADHLVNMKVAKDSSDNDSPNNDSPALTLSNYCMDAGWHGTSVGMMTAASMKSFRMAKVTEQGVELVVLVTSGLSNARRVGDRAECRTMTEESKEVGTINIVFLTSAKLTDAASVEAVLVITEAKAAALQDTKIMSPISNEIATGTGTDSVAVVSGHGSEIINYCGKHVLFGEILGRLVMDTVASSIAWGKPFSQ
jgi:adenosylcobinamide amidohydrolase